MTTKETLGRRVLALEHRRRPRKPEEMSDDELACIVMGYPCRAADITDEEIQEILDAIKGREGGKA